MEKKIIALVCIVQLFLLVVPISIKSVDKTLAATYKEMFINFAESTSRNQVKTITIPNLQEVGNISTDNGDVSFVVSGEDVTITVDNGDYSNYDSYWSDYKYSKYVTYNKYDSGTCPWAVGCKTKEESGMYSSMYYSDAYGYSGTIYETSYSYYQDPPPGTTPEPASYYWSRSQSSGGTVYSGGWVNYNYTYEYNVTLYYIDNKDPTVTLEPGYNNKILADYPGYSIMDINGAVEDPEGDSVTIEIDIAGLSKSQVVSNTLTSKPFSITFDVISDKLPSGIHSVRVYADDGWGKILVETFNVTVSSLVENEKYVLVNEPLFYLTGYSDPEKDSKFAEEFKYEHDENYFENNLGRINDHQVWRDSSYESLSKPGRYQVSFRVQDNPSTDTAFMDFRKWSEPSVALNLYVHRKPISAFEAYIDQVTGQVAIIDKSYDLDTSKGRDGISLTTYRYREIGQYTWLEGKPATLDINKEYEFEQTVWDYQTESDTSIQAVVKTGVLPNVPPVPGFIHNSPYYIGDTVFLKSTAVDPDNDPLTFTYTVVKPNGEQIVYVTGDPEVSANGDLTLKAGNVDVDIGEWRITQLVDDGKDYEVYIDTITVFDQLIEGFVEHTPKWSDIHAEKGNSPGQFYSGETFILKASVTDSPITKLEVVFNGKQINGSNLNLKTTLSPLTSISWEGELYQDSMISPLERLDGNAEFVFTVYYSNGYVVSDNVTVEIIGSAYQALKFHRKY